MKQIYCPKCHTGYEIDENLIPEDGKKLRCSYCNQVFKAYCDDLIDAPVRTVAIEDDEPSAAQKSVSEETSAAEEAVSEESSKVSTEAETTETPSQTAKWTTYSNDCLNKPRSFSKPRANCPRFGDFYSSADSL